MFPLKDDNPTDHAPILTIALIVANVLAFLYQLSQGPAGEMVVWKFGFVPYELTHGVELTPEAAFPALGSMFTSMFLHGGFMHLGGNMLYLWIFGNNVEDIMRPVPFLIFYLAAGVIATLLFVASGPATQIPLVGASGAVSGVLGLYVTQWPKARILTLIFFGWFIRMIWIPAVFVLGIWFVMQLLFALPSIGQQSGGGVAYMAHVGGFVFGLAVGLFYRRRRTY
ncbi:MAG: rhomboid family intramembrane serine protease [Candidatus Zixiibacteriota bacterium]